MVKTLLLAVAVAAVVTGSWARLEQPRPSLGVLIVVAGLAVAPALIRGRARILGVVVATAIASGIALDIPFGALSPFDGRDFVGLAVERTWNGFLDFYDVTVPFDGIGQPLMHGAMLMAAFTFSLAAALAIAARRPPLALAALLLGAGWPATILPEDHQLLRGALILALGLALLAVVQQERLKLRSQLTAGVAVAVLALALSSSGAVAKSQFVDWQSWDFYNRPDAPVGVSYVWTADYDGVEFPNKRTRVLRVRAPSRAGYWRATTLDEFVEDRWDEALILSNPPVDGSRADLSGDPLVPRAGRDQDNWTRVDVLVEGLRDRHLVAAAVPVMYDTPDLPDPAYAEGGVAVLPRATERGDEYTAWTYAPRPKPSELARSDSDYPFELVGDGRYLGIERGVTPPPFGAPNRARWFDELFAFDLDLQGYEPLYRQALQLAGDARTPYAAVVALEAWFRAGGGFRYDETPRVAPPGTPPLVHFLTEAKEGYCQHFAGAMALMLRYLGIPARVAAGFTSGIFDRDRRVWNVTDRNAHAWVEVWFEGFGWLPFDPTPGRGNLSGPYSASSFSFDATGARDVLTAAGLAAANELLRFQLERGASGSASGAITPRDLRRSTEAAEEGRGFGATQIVTLVLIGLALALVVGKLLRRRVRYLTRDPRRIAAACRREVVELLADQRIDVPRSATLEDLRQLVSRQTGVELRRLVAALALARFGPAGSAAMAARHARNELRVVRKRFRRALSTGARIRGAFSLRSLVLR